MINIDQRFQSRRKFDLNHEIDEIVIVVDLFDFRHFSSFIRLSQIHYIDHQSFFFCVVFNLTKQSYKDLKLMQKMKKIFDCKIFVNVALITISISNSCVIAYNSTINTLRVIRLHLTNDQCKKLILLIESIKQITNSI